MLEPGKETVFLYLCKNKDQLTTDEKVIAIVTHHVRTETMDAAALKLERTPKGKPYFPAAPQLQISVSHSGEWFICAVSRKYIGVDLQKPSQRHDDTDERTAQRYGRIAQRYFHPTEAAFVQEDPLHRFPILWTAKESYVKFTGQGIDRSFGVHCILGDLPQRLLCGGERVSWQAESVFFQAGRIGSFTLCTCTPVACEWELREITNL